MAGSGQSLPVCSVCCENLGRYGGPCTLPCGHNGCLQCLAHVQRRAAPACPLCRAPFASATPLVLNRELRDLMALAAALTTVEDADGWQAVTCRADCADAECGMSGKRGACAAPSAPPLLPGARVDVRAVLEGAAGAMQLEPPRWLPDSAAGSCMARGCAKPFSLVRTRHHCRACGLLYCAACSDGRMLLPPRFNEPSPQRVCSACAEILAPLQPLLAGTVAAAAQPPVHDAHDWAAWRALLSPPLSSGLAGDVHRAAKVLRQWAASASGAATAPGGGGTTEPWALPRAALAGAAGVAVLTLLRVGAGWSGGLGTGLVVARRRPRGGCSGGGWSAPSAVLALSAGLGWQLGAELVDLVVVLRSPEALGAFCSGYLSLAASAGVAAGPVGRSAAAGLRLGGGGGALCATYCASRGAFAGVAVEGTLLRPRDAANLEFYGCQLAAAALLCSDAVPAPAGAAPLYAALEELERAEEMERKEGRGAAEGREAQQQRGAAGDLVMAPLFE